MTTVFHETSGSQSRRKCGVAPDGLLHRIHNLHVYEIVYFVLAKADNTWYGGQLRWRPRTGKTMAVALMLAIFPVIATADDTKSQQQQEQTTDVSAPLVAEIETLKAAAQEVDGKNAENTARFIQAARVLRRSLNP